MEARAREAVYPRSNRYAANCAHALPRLTNAQRLRSHIVSHGAGELVLNECLLTLHSACPRLMTLPPKEYRAELSRGSTQAAPCSANSRGHRTAKLILDAIDGDRENRQERLRVPHPATVPNVCRANAQELLEDLLRLVESGVLYKPVEREVVIHINREPSVAGRRYLSVTINLIRRKLYMCDAVFNPNASGMVDHHFRDDSHHLFGCHRPHRPHSLTDRPVGFQVMPARLRSICT